MRWLDRLRSEARRAPDASDTVRAIGELVIRDGPADAIARELTGAERVGLVDRGEGVPLTSATPHDVVQLAKGVYASIPGTEGRVQLLRALRAVAKRIVIHVPVIDENSHVGRVVVDAPRALLRAAKMPVPEPGDRFGPEGYAHCFFDEEPLYAEIAEAGLAPVARRGFTFLLEHQPGPRGVPIEHADPFPVEVARAAALAREAEHVRLHETPEHALRAMRARGRQQKERGPVARARLRRAISWVDAAMGASCYRRVLLELGLDAGAARERVAFGLDVGRTGHAAFENREDRTFDVVFMLGPDEG